MSKRSSPIYVTRPFLPPLEKYIPYLEKIWENKYLTNNGPFHKQLETALCNYLGVNYISLFCNGTIALLVAIRALELKGNIITTPFSFVATSHAIRWNNMNPVFIDIDPNTCNLDYKKIEEALTKQTSAILPVHVYGYPCNNKKITEIARKHNLKIIYDAAHAFGVKKNGKSIYKFDDLSVLSFHATKVFNTFEGGAIVSNSLEMKNKIDDFKNFCIHDEFTVDGIGINGKMNEIQCAMGLLQLKYIDTIISKRKVLSDLYKIELENINGIKILKKDVNINYNYAYFPIFINEKKFGKSLEKIYNEFREKNIFVRRYFYPLISKINGYNKLPSSCPKNLPNAERISKEVICLPIYPGMTKKDIYRVVQILKKD